MLEDFDSASILVLGSGTSVGVPMIGCHCRVCRSSDPRDKRLRPSVLVRFGPHRVLIDTSPDFRYQALRSGPRRLDAILYTHSHADHILGLDDVRPFNFMQKHEIPIHGSPETLAVIGRAFQYVFDEEPTESSKPQIVPRPFNHNPISIAGLDFQPIRLAHGQGAVHGFRFGDCAYLTDHSSIPPDAALQLESLDVLFLDALRHNPHPTHSTIEQSLETVVRLKPKRAFFTHISHDLSHATVEARLPPGVRLAFDGLEIPIGRSAHP